MFAIKMRNLGMSMYRDIGPVDVSLMPQIV